MYPSACDAAEKERERGFDRDGEVNRDDGVEGRSLGRGARISVEDE